MDHQTQGILTLLRGALTGEKLTLPEDFDWASASTTFYQHQMVALAVRGAPRCGVSVSHPELKRLMALFCGDVCHQAPVSPAGAAGHGRRGCAHPL